MKQFVMAFIRIPQPHQIYKQHQPFSQPDFRRKQMLVGTLGDFVSSQIFSAAAMRLESSGPE